MKAGTPQIHDKENMFEICFFRSFLGNQKAPEITHLPVIWMLHNFFDVGAKCALRELWIAHEDWISLFDGTMGG